MPVAVAVALTLALGAASCGSGTDSPGGTSAGTGATTPGTSSSTSGTASTVAGTTSSTETSSTTGPTSSSAAPTSTTTATALVTTTTADNTGGIDPMVGADTADKSGAGTGVGVGLLSDVRAARHEGFDRVVFQFANHVPAFSVRYVNRPVIADGSGDEVAVSGAYVLQVHMEPASGVDLSVVDPSGAITVTYTGPKRFSPDTPQVAELVQIGDFEAVLAWAIGVRDRADFRVSTLSSPARLIIDIRNH